VVCPTIENLFDDEVVRAYPDGKEESNRNRQGPEGINGPKREHPEGEKHGQHEELAMGEIKDVHHAPNQRQPDGDQGKDQTHEQAANQYLQVSYNSPTATNWKIWVYTKNDNGDPQYLGGQYNGLMSSDGRSRVPLVWRVYEVVKSGGVACRTNSDVHSGSTMTWNYLKDKNDSDWATANQPGQEYSVVAFGRLEEWAYIAPVPPGLGDRHPSNNTFYLYLGGEFGAASPGDYSAKIYRP